MKSNLRFSREAVRDIEEALAYTREQFGERKFEQYRDLIQEALARIAADPDNPQARRRPEIHPDARTLHLARRGKRARHYLLYRVAADGHVDVGRLLHDSMELKRHLPEGFEASD
jgi:toxin ParE1/3/4